MSSAAVVIGVLRVKYLLIVKVFILMSRAFVVWLLVIVLGKCFLKESCYFIPPQKIYCGYSL